MMRPSVRVLGWTLPLILVTLISTTNAWAQDEDVGYQPDDSVSETVYCLDEEDNVIPNCDVEMAIIYLADDARGHENGHSTRPKSVTTCDSTSPCSGWFNTGSGGLRLDIDTPNIITEEWYEACADYCATLHAYIGYLFFAELPSNTSRYIRIGETDEHPDNWWGTVDTIDALEDIADDYYNEFNGETWFDPDSEWVPAYNDISVGLTTSPWYQGGGIFDVDLDWSGTSNHQFHKTGLNADIRLEGPGCHDNYIHPDAKDEFEDIVSDYGGTTAEHGSGCGLHYHVNFN